MAFGIDNPVSHFKKSNFSTNFKKELVRSCNFELRKTGPKELMHEPISVFHVDERSYLLPKISNIIVFGTVNRV